jgi:hypothetical protein
VRKPKPLNTVYDQTSKRVTFMNKNPANEIAFEFVESNYTKLITFTKFLIQIKVKIDKHSMLHGRSHISLPASFI